MLYAYIKPFFFVYIITTSVTKPRKNENLDLRFFFLIWHQKKMLLWEWHVKSKKIKKKIIIIINVKLNIWHWGLQIVNAELYKMVRLLFPLRDVLSFGAVSLKFRPQNGFAKNLRLRDIQYDTNQNNFLQDPLIFFRDHLPPLQLNVQLLNKSKLV